MPEPALIRPLVLTLVLFLAAAAPAQPTPAVAVSTAPTRVAFVDVELVLEDSQAIRDLIGELDTELGKQATEIDTRKTELRRLRLALEQQGPVLSASEREVRQQKALDMIQEIDELEFKFQSVSRRKQRETVEPILEEVIKIIADVAKRDRFDIVVRGENVLYGAKSVDLTDEVTREVDVQKERLRGAISKIARQTPPVAAGPPLATSSSMTTPRQLETPVPTPEPPRHREDGRLPPIVKPGSAKP